MSIFLDVEKSIGIFANNSLKIAEKRKAALYPLINLLKDNGQHQPITLVFICTHNSRRSHLCQAICHGLARYFNWNELFSFSGGTEVTAVYPSTLEALRKLGFSITTLKSGDNPIYQACLFYTS
ncbi:MAG: protein-tyrosine-phosphatase, partial [Alphaproteobacteria bacterium]|nr:protein-tyrosine-phosphatase [Alphaproteobacteria bacterium]